jgi:tetratricopeptide (TPR) repeat protein
MFFKQPKYLLLFSCCAILIIIIVLALAAPALIKAVKADREMITQYNFPRHLTETELAVPPEIQKNVRYTLIKSDSTNRGREINWTRILDNGPYDVVVISDSFLGVRAGRNICRKISADNNVSVLHIYTNDIAYSRGNPFRMLILLTNNGYLKKTGAQVVIIETAERVLPRNIIIWNTNESKPLPVPVSGKKKTSLPASKSTQLSRDSVLTTINKSLGSIDNYFNGESRDLIILKTWIKNDLLSVTGPQSNDGSLYFVQINESRFTSPGYESRLFIHNEDINFFHQPNATIPDDYIRMNNDLNVIAGKLHDQNINLIFMPAVSAYSTYYVYTIDPPTVRNPLFEILRELDRSYILIDTKAISEKVQQKGEKDLSGIGDPAHWTWRLTEPIAEEIDLNAKPDITPGTADQDTEEAYDRAVQAFRDVIYERGDPNDPWAFKMDGAIYERANDAQNATRCYQRSLELDPRQPDLRKRLEKIMKNSSLTVN